MHFSEEQLRDVIDGKIIGAFFPFQGGTYNQVVYFYKDLIAALERSRLLKVITDYSSYGSGYASYVDVFCYKRDGSSTQQKKGYMDIEGIGIYLCKHAPVAIVGPNQKSISERGGSYGMLSVHQVGKMPPGNWDQEFERIREVLTNYQIEILTRRIVNQPLPFDAKIPTVLDQGDGYRVFDALFYWED